MASSVTDPGSRRCRLHTPVTPQTFKRIDKGLTGSWYALRVRPGFERCVQAQLERKGYDTYIPSRSATESAKSARPLLPSYVFCRFSSNSHSDILVTPGVLFVAGDGKSLLPVEGSELFALDRALESGVELTPWSYPPNGGVVTVETGPLAGIQGTLVSDSGTEKLAISISVLMVSFCVTLTDTTIKSFKIGA
jgi:transcription antitermination factor NusG